MKLTFLGTAAAEGIPSPFCNCATCRHARETGGRNVRKRQSLLVNDDLLIDIGPDLFASCAQLGISLTEVRHLLVTHSHLDHFNPDNLVLRAKPFRLETELPEMTVVAGPSVWMKWELSGGRDAEAGIVRVPMLPGGERELGPYTVRSIAATHQLRMGDAMNYILHDSHVTVLHASDTGYYEEEVWRQLEGVHLDAIVMESTIGWRASGKEHLNFGDLGRMMERLQSIGAISDRTVKIATHFSHQGVKPYEETKAILEQMGIVCAYDGMISEVVSG
ncbi:MBL fold metallo-hydrolase [Paenibacillus oryzisoli]|uniref:MBL fold metallo-hydrolase n=1 Tax=Paenibacillus oryzisoli TaxID=1850517 RepID=UPI003D2AC9B2